METEWPSPKYCGLSHELSWVANQESLVSRSPPSSSSVAWISHTPSITSGNVNIEWSANNGQAALYINGSLVGQDNFSDPIAGGNPGGLAGNYGNGIRSINIDNSIFVNDNDILTCEIYLDEHTSDV